MPDAGQEYSRELYYGQTGSISYDDTWIPGVGEDPWYPTPYNNYPLRAALFSQAYCTDVPIYDIELIRRMDVDGTANTLLKADATTKLPVDSAIVENGTNIIVTSRNLILAVTATGSIGSASILWSAIYTNALTIGTLDGVLKATAGAVSGSAVHSNLGGIGADDHHATATAGTGISITGQQITNTDLGSTVVSTYLDQAVKQASSPQFSAVTLVKASGNSFISYTDTTTIAFGDNFIANSVAAGGLTFGVNNTSPTTGDVIFLLNKAAGGNSAVLSFKKGGVESWQLGTGIISNNEDLHFYGNSVDVIKLILSGAVISTLVLKEGNVGLGVTTFGTSANRVLGIGNGTIPSDVPANMIQIFSVDSSDALATLGLFLEQTVAVIGVTVATTKIKIKINGTEYYLLLSTI